MDYGRSIAKFIRVSPRKARLAADLVRGLKVPEAEQQLAHCGLKGGKLLGKVLTSAVANAENQNDVRQEDLYVTEIRVDTGPTLKRGKPRSKGSRSPILKRTSHLTVVVGTK